MAEQSDFDQDRKSLDGNVHKKNDDLVKSCSTKWGGGTGKGKRKKGIGLAKVNGRLNRGTSTRPSIRGVTEDVVTKRSGWYKNARVKENEGYGRNA